jgi:hypothetical protein
MIAELEGLIDGETDRLACLKSGMPDINDIG